MMVHLQWLRQQCVHRRRTLAVAVALAFTASSQPLAQARAEFRARPASNRPGLFRPAAVRIGRHDQRGRGPHVHRSGAAGRRRYGLAAHAHATTTRNSGRKWHFGFAGVPIRDRAVPSATRGSAADDPELIMADGALRQNLPRQQRLRRHRLRHRRISGGTRAPLARWRCPTGDGDVRGGEPVGGCHAGRGARRLREQPDAGLGRWGAWRHPALRLESVTQTVTCREPDGGLSIPTRSPRRAAESPRR